MSGKSTMPQKLKIATKKKRGKCFFIGCSENIVLHYYLKKRGYHATSKSTFFFHKQLNLLKDPQSAESKEKSNFIYF